MILDSTLFFYGSIATPPATGIATIPLAQADSKIVSTGNFIPTNSIGNINDNIFLNLYLSSYPQVGGSTSNYLSVWPYFVDDPSDTGATTRPTSTVTNKMSTSYLFNLPSTTGKYPANFAVPLKTSSKLPNKRYLGCLVCMLNSGATSSINTFTKWTSPSADKDVNFALFLTAGPDMFVPAAKSSIGVTY